MVLDHINFPFFVLVGRQTLHARNLNDSGAMICADVPFLDEETDPYGIPTSTTGVLGQSEVLDTSPENVVISKAVRHPIFSEVRICSETNWLKVWLSKDDCRLIDLDDTGKAALKTVVEKHSRRACQLLWPPSCGRPPTTHSRRVC